MPKNILKITGIICCTTILCFAAPAFAAQPLITDDTGTMGVMKFQLETGTEFGWNREDNNGVATDAPYQLLSLTLTAGVLDSLGLVLALPFCWQQVEENGLKTYDNGGLHDLSLALKWSFLELGPASFALKPSITIPSGDYNRGLSNARPAYGTTLISTVEFKPVTISANAGYTFQKYTDADRSTCRENLWNLSMSGTTEIFKGLQMVAEIGMTSNANSASTSWPSFITGGLIYSVLDTLDIDAGIKCGLNNPAPDFALLIGFSVRTP